MAQANVIDITAAQESRRFFGQLEHDVDGVFRKVHMLMSLMNHHFADRETHRKIFEGRENCFLVDTDAMDTLFFLIDDLKDRVDDLREQVSR